MFLGLGLRFGGSGVAGAGGGGGGGGYSLDSNLPTPTLSLAVGKTTYPPQFSASFTGGFYAGDQIEFWSAASYAALATAMASTGTLLDDDDDNGLVDATLSGIASGLTYAAVRLRLPSNSTYGPTSNIILHGDATAPTLTSSTSTNVDELQTVLYTATFSELVNTPTLTGTDASLLAVSGSSPATSYSIVLASGGQLDYETQTSYSFSIAATDLADNALGATAIAVTINNLDDVPDVFTFNGVLNPTASTTQTSNTITVAGTTGGLTLPGTFAGPGEYNKNSTGWVTTSPFTFTVNDTFQVRHTSSSDGSGVSTVIDLNGRSGTFTSVTPTVPATANRVLQLEAADSANLFQLITGATAATANNDPIGTWKDKNGNGFDLAAPANDGTRPTLQGVGTYPAIRFDRVSSQYLFRAASLGLYSGGACTIMFSVKMDTTPAVRQAFCSEGLSSASNPAYEILRLNVDNNDVASFVKDNAGNVVVNGTNLYDEGVQNATDVVIIIVDTGTALTVYIDGVAGTASNYTRATSTGWDRFSLGALLRTTAEDFLDGDVYGALFYNAALNSSDITSLNSYGASLHGRVI